MTYNIELGDKPGATGLHHIMIRLHQKGYKPARIQFPHEIEKRHWNPKKPHGKWIRASYLYSEKLNEDIEKSYSDVKETVEGYLKKEPFLSPKDCKLRYESGGNVTLYKPLADQALKRVNVSPFTVVDGAHVLKAFFKAVGEHLTLEQITPALLLTYRNALLADGKKNSTINQYISILRTLYEQVQQSRGVSRRELLASSPFVELKKLSAKSAPKGRLREKGIEALKQGAYTFYYQTQKRSGSRPKFHWPDWGRWCFLACYYQAGMRIGDLLRSRYEWYELDSEGYPVRLRYRMQKNGKLIPVKLSSEAIAHLKLIWKVGSRPDSYLLPFLDPKAAYFPYRSYEQIRAMPAAASDQLIRRLAARTAQLNKALRKAASDRGIDPIGGKLTNHSARHSVGDAVVRAMKAGKAVTVFDFQAMFGHSSVQTSEIYRGELDESSLDSAVEAVLGI